MTPARLYLLLVLLGLGWGLTVPLAAIAGRGAYTPLGLTTFELAVIALAALVWLKLRGRPTGLARRHLPLYFWVSLLGTLGPNLAFYTAIRELSGGVVSIVVAMVPMFTLGLALMLRLERPSLRRLLGIAAGAAAMVVLAGPQGALPEGTRLVMVLLVALTPLFYAIEDVYIDHHGTEGIDSAQVILGSSLAGLVMILPVTLARGELIDVLQPWDVRLVSMLAASLLHGAAYATFIWMIGKAGAVFAGQVSYLVTGSGVLWSMLILRESHSGWFWLALMLILGGMFLVRPADKAAVATGQVSG